MRSIRASRIGGISPGSETLPLPIRHSSKNPSAGRLMLPYSGFWRCLFTMGCSQSVGFGICWVWNLLGLESVRFGICWVWNLLGFALRACYANVTQPNLRIKIFLIGAPILLNNTGAPIVPCGVRFLARIPWW
ncbi:MAG: hypothetical protein RLZZ338_767 [Cyanobacteriota bacterium]